MYTINNNDIILLAEGRLVNLGCATGHPSCYVQFIYESGSSPNRNMNSQNYDNKVYMPKSI